MLGNYNTTPLRFNTAVVYVILLLQCCVQVVQPLQGHGSYVMSLDSRFDSTRGETPYLVEFYAPWCGHCKKLEPVYEHVAAKLDGTGIAVAKVDATLYTDIAATYDVHGFPTILYIQADKTVNYRGDRSVEDITRFAIRCRSPPLQTLHSYGGLKDRLRHNKDVFFVYVGEQDHHMFTLYKKVAEEHSIAVDFFTANNKAFQQVIGEDAKLPLVMVYKDDQQYQFDPMTHSNLDEWVQEERYTALQSAKGSAYYDLMSLDKLLVLLVPKEDTESGVDVVKLSQRVLDAVKPVAMDKQLRKQFQFVLMGSTSTISGIILGGVTTPYAIAFHPQTHLYYTADRPVSEMNSDDWREFLTGVVTGSIQSKGGKGFIRQLQRALYGLISSILDIWNESRMLFGIVVVLPTFVIFVVIYTLCCMSWAEDEEEGEELDSEDEGEEGEPAELQTDADTGHHKTE